MKLKEFVDVLIPRGGASLIKSVVNNSTVPVIETGVGNCHISVDKYADINMAVDIIYNAKTSRVSVCNACESLLIHKDVDKAFYKKVYDKLKEKDVFIAGCNKTMENMPCDALATEDDYNT